MATEISGPVEIAVIEFPGSRFNGQILPALAGLVDDGIVRIVDLVLITRDSEGTIAAIEVSELDDDGMAAAINDLDGEVTGVLSHDDIATAGETLAPGASALMIVWENIWAQRLVDAVTESGGRLIAHDRLDAETVADALSATS